MNGNIIKNHHEFLLNLWKSTCKNKIKSKVKQFLLKRGKYMLGGILNTEYSIECKIMKICLAFGHSS
jgi:hypothetical protein